MAAITTYVVESGKSYPKLMPKIYRLVLDGDREVARYEIIDFAEVASLAPNVFLDFISQYKEFLSGISDSINPEAGISTFNYYTFSELEGSAMYITNNIPLADRESAVDVTDSDIAGGE